MRDDAESAIWSVDQYSLSLAFPFYKDKEIVRGMRVGFADADGVFQVFEVRQAKAYEPDHYQEIEAEHIAVAELNDEFCSERDVTDETAESVVESLLTGTRWQVGNVTDESETVLSAYDETKNHETVGNAMVAVLGTGNVDLLNRPQVPASDLENAGWEDAGTGTATVFSVSYSAGSDGVPYARDLILHMTPIMANGTIKTPAQMETYVDTLLTKKTDAEILARDLPSSNGYGLILWIQTVMDWDDAYDLAEVYDNYLHNMQAAYYLNDFSDLPTADELRGLYAYTKEAAGGTLSSVNIGDGAVWQSIRNVEHNWNVWITPRITVNSTGITGRYLDIAPAEGVWRGVRLSVAKNMDNAGVTYDDSEVKTALYAFGRQKDKDKLTFTDTAWTATQDHPGKPAGQAYLEDPTAKALYGRNGRNRFGFYQNSDITDPVVLLEKTWESLQTQNHPKVTIDCMVADLHRLGYADQDIRLHDKVLVDLPEIGKVETLDVIKLDIDLLDPTRTQPTIGAYIPNIIFIDREAGAAARGGYGRNSGQSNAEYERAEFTTEIARNEQEIRLRAYQTDLNRTDAEVLRAFTQIDLDATRIESLATGSGVMLDENGELVVDTDGNPVFITDVAVNFNPATYYPAGTYINYNGKVYRLKEAHVPGQPWDSDNASEEKFGVYSKVIQNADAIELRVVKGDVATQLTVEVGNVHVTGGNLVVDGYLEANGVTTTAGGTLTADTLEARFGEIDTVSALSVTAGSFSGADHYYMDSYSGDLVDSIKGVQVIADGNNYKLQYKTFAGDTWTDAGTFSRAAKFSGAWNGSGTYTVTADPNGSTSLSVTPGLRLGGNGGTTFTAQMTSDEQTVQKTAPGYLVASGRTVTVYTQYVDGQYTGSIASINTLPNSAAVTNKTPASSTDYADRILYRKKSDGTYTSYINGNTVYVFTSSINIGTRTVYY